MICIYIYIYCICHIYIYSILGGNYIDSLLNSYWTLLNSHVCMGVSRCCSRGKTGLRSVASMYCGDAELSIMARAPQPAPSSMQ